MSTETASSSDTVPAGMRPGHRATKQTRCPPSQVVPLPPRSGPLLAPWRVAPPLSDVKITNVLSSIPSSSSLAMIWPVDQSISSTASPHAPFADLPANRSEEYCGQCGIVWARYRKNGPSRLASMKLRASSV